MNASAFSEPFTPRGVASFAGAKWTRLFIAQIILACLAAASVICLFSHSYFPTVQTAIDNLPPDGEIRFGHLDWTGSPQMLAESRSLAFVVDPYHSGQFLPSADIQIEFGQDTIRVFSLFGYVDFFYPLNYDLAFNRTDLSPQWKAWRAEILFAVALMTVISLLLTWWILATFYFLPVWLISFFTNRDLSLPGCWKLSGAALLPGALLMAAGFFLYGLGILGLFPFLFIFGAHVILGWIYLVCGVAFFTRVGTAPPPGNPFKHDKPQA
jgi:hypothetical protein